jgi:hypothetical protein
VAPLAILGRRRRPGRSAVPGRQEFLAACRRTKRPILSLREDLTISNIGAAHLLDHDGYAIVRERAIELAGSPREMTGEVLLSDGQVARLRCRPVVSSTGPAGTIVEIQVPDERGTLRRVAVTPRASLPGLAGQSPVWVRVCQEVDGHCRARSWLLLVGGWIWQATAFKTKIPQQVNRFRIESAAVPATFAAATMDKIVYDRKAQTLTMNVQAVNQGKSGMDLRAVPLRQPDLPAWHRCGRRRGGRRRYLHDLAEGSIAAGATQPLTLTIKGRALTTNDLIPSGTANSKHHRGARIHRLEQQQQLHHRSASDRPAHEEPEEDELDRLLGKERARDVRRRARRKRAMRRRMLRADASAGQGRAADGDDTLP